MKKNFRHIFFGTVIVFFAGFNGFSQNKSAKIQTIEGKKYYLHKVEKSQSLYAISKLYTVTLEEIYDANPEVKKGLKAGQEIKIPCFNSGGNSATSSLPATTADTGKYVTHKIQKGETVYSLCKKFNLSEKLINVYNPNINQTLKEGQVIIVGEKNKTLSKSQAVKETPKENKPVVKEPRSMTVPADSSQFKPPAKPKKNSYNAALILPFRLEDVNNLDLNDMLKGNISFPAVPALAIDFYIGFKKALDSLATKDFSVNVECFDMDEKDTIKTILFAANPRFKDFDLIFGPLYASSFKTVARKAREYHIPIISPIIQQNKILYNNIYVSKTNPSQFTLLENLGDYCMDSLVQPGTKVLLMAPFEGDKKEAQFVNAFKKYFNEKMLARKMNKDTLRIVKGMNGLKNAFTDGAKHIIVSLSNNHVFIADFTTQLAVFSEEKDVTLCSWESLRSMDNIDQAYLNQLHYTFPCQHDLSFMYSDNALAQYYRAVQGTLPAGEFYYSGFDIGYYYFKNLRDEGPGFFYDLAALPTESHFIRFKFSRPDNATGFDNRGTYIFRYADYKLKKTGWK